MNPATPMSVTHPSPDESRAGLALRAATVRVDARAGLARVVLEQRFANRYAEPLTITYRMPLPHGAAVSGYSFRVGERRIVGEVERREVAKDRFEQALLEGRTAGLIEEERGGLFTQELGNVPPGAFAVVELVLDQALVWLDEGAWEWRFPMTAAPRFLGAAGAVADAERVAVEIGEGLDARVALELIIRDDLVEGRSPESPSHALSVAPIRGALRGELRDGAIRLDRDLTVRWPVARPAVGVAVDLARGPEGSPLSDAFALITIVPPACPGDRAARAVPRDLIVLLDTSGSMAGRPLEQARRVVAALVDGLCDDDRLELVQFSGAARRWRPEPAAATLEARQDALAWLARLEAAGGTEMRAGIEEALAVRRPESQRQVVLVTDGLVGFESEVVAVILARLPASSRLHTVGVGSAVNRSLTGPAARAGRGVEVVIGLDEDPERAACRLLARCGAPLVVDLELEGPGLLAVAPERLPDLFAGAPIAVSARLDPAGGELVVRGRTALGAWEQRVSVPPVPPSSGNAGVIKLFGREAAQDLEMRLAAGAAIADIDRDLERIGLSFQIATRRTSWIAVHDEPGAPGAEPARREIVPLELPFGISAEGLGLRRAATPSAGGSAGSQERPEARRSRGRGANEFEEKTTVTRVIGQATPALAPATNDCLIIIYAEDSALLGKRFVLEESPTRVGRGADNHIVLDFDSVSRRHAHFERGRDGWRCVDDASKNGTYRNDEPIEGEAALENGDRVNIGPTIFKYLSGADVEAQYFEEIYRMTIIDGLTQIHNRRYFDEALDREIVRSRRHARPLALLMFDIDHFRKVNEKYGHLGGDYVLKELARLFSARIRSGEVFARYGGEEFAVILPESSLAGAVALAEALRQRAAEHEFAFRGQHIKVSISVGAAILEDADRAAEDLVRRADKHLFGAKNAGRNRVVS